MYYYILAFLAMTLYASLAPIAKKISLENNIPPLLFIAITMTILTIGAGTLSYLYEKPQISTIRGGQWKLLILFGVINLTGFVIYLTSIKFIPVSHYTIIGVMTPIVAGIISYFLLGEKLNLNFLIGFIFVSLGIYIAISKKSII